MTASQQLAVAALHSGEGGSAVCTATLIEGGFALTAAHCMQFGRLEVRISGDSLGAPIGAPLRHPDFDVMLLPLDGNALARSGADSLLPYEGIVGPHWIQTAVTLAGTGRTEQGATGELRFVRERVIDVTDTEIWVDGMGRTGACDGDSGGPLLVPDAAGTPRVAGVLGRGSEDCVGLDAYLRIDAIADWLRTATGTRGVPEHGACSIGR